GGRRDAGEGRVDGLVRVDEPGSVAAINPRRPEAARGRLDARFDGLRLRVLADHAGGDDQRRDRRDVRARHRRALVVRRAAERLDVAGEGDLVDVAAALVRVAVLEV